jgi:hypothetical protein
LWQVYDSYNGTNGLYLWGKRNCLPYAGQFSGWAVGGGTVGATLGCGSSYPNDADSWMVYGPFSLEGAAAADMQFKVWMSSEYGFDQLCRLASVDGVSFSGDCTSGVSEPPEWITETLVLSDVLGLGSLLGQPQVWVALNFLSDSSVNMPVGAYVDDIVVRKCMAAPCPANTVAHTEQVGVLERSGRRTLWR